MIFLLLYHLINSETNILEYSNYSIDSNVKGIITVKRYKITNHSIRRFTTASRFFPYNLDVFMASAPSNTEFSSPSLHLAPSYCETSCPSIESGCKDPSRDPTE